MAERSFFYQTWKEQVSLAGRQPGIFFYGEQAIYLRRLLSEVAAEAEKGGRGFKTHLFFLFDSDWESILEEARSRDLFFSGSYKVIVVYFPEADETDQQAADRTYRQLVASYEKEIEYYFDQPSEGVSIFIVYPGRLKKGNKILDFFSRLKSRKPDKLQLVEMRTPREPELLAWIQQEVKKRRQRISPQAAARLLEVVGPELVSLSQEIEKLSLYAGERDLFSEEDILTVCAFQKTFDRFAIEEALESGSLEEALNITERFLSEQPEPNEILSFFSTISRYVLSLAQARFELDRKQVPLKEIFKRLRPQLDEGWSLFDRKFEAFKNCLMVFSQEELHALVRELGRVDTKLKSTDLEAGILIESFLVRFFELRDKKIKS